MNYLAQKSRPNKIDASCLCLSHGSIKLLLLYIEIVEKWYFSVRALIFSRNFSEELSRKNEMDLS